MTCERCHGEGTVGRNIPGNEGVPEMDVEVDCHDCKGTGQAHEECDRCGERFKADDTDGIHCGACMRKVPNFADYTGPEWKDLL